MPVRWHVARVSGFGKGISTEAPKTHAARTSCRRSPTMPLWRVSIRWLLPGDSGHALRVLDRLDENAFGAAGHALRAHLLAESGGSDEEIEECISRTLRRGRCGITDCGQDRLS